MAREEVFERLTKIFREVFDNKAIKLEETTSSEDIEDWDSFEHINLIVAIEEEFSFKIPIEKIVTMTNVGKIADIIVELKK